MTRFFRQALLILSTGLALSTSACTKSVPMNRAAEVKAMLTREIPVGMRREDALAKLDSLRIPHTVLNSAGAVVRALVRNTSRSAITAGSLQVLLRFRPDSTLLEHEFKEMFVAP